MRSFLDRVALVVLALWLAPALAVAPVVAMTPQMSMSDDAGSGCCLDMDRKVCALTCVSVSPLAITVDHGHLSAIGWRRDSGPWRTMALSGRCLSPDPPPPRTASLR